MSVGSDWSLHIHNLNTQDIGQYLCEQYVNGYYYEPGRTTVDLFLLSISASPSGGLKTDTVLTLQCGLDCGGGFQSCAGKPADVQVTWESDHMDTVDIKRDRYFSSLSMKLQSSDHMRNWTCVLRERGVMKTSDTYTIHLTGDVGPKAYTTAPPREASDNHFLEKTSAAVAGAVCALLVVLVVVFLLMKRRRRGGRRMASAGPGVCVTTEEDLIVYASPTEPTEQSSPAPGGNEVNYASVTLKDKERGRSGQAVPEDSTAVIYSNLRR
ncbi:uncharacterized protein [Lepisosteus oculatus]|uniref:uncharacterized protein isoform X2 n=1 Tax=Lepisosteus oculatus TaxID=7918 RepID=UPI0035F50808